MGELLTYFRSHKDKVGDWLDIKLDLAPEGVSYNVTYFFNKGEALARTVDPNWNFYHEAQEFRSIVIIHIMDAVKQRGLSFAIFPVRLAGTAAPMQAGFAPVEHLG